METFQVIPDDLLLYASPEERKAYEFALYKHISLRSPLDFLLAVRPHTDDFTHQRLISDEIANLEEGGKLLITMPPRLGKSLVVSEGGPAWVLSTNPNNRVLHATYGHDFTVTFGRNIRRYLQENARTLAPRLDPSAKAIDSFFIHPHDGTGYYFGDGRGGGFTGKGGDWIFLDDLIKDAEEAESPTVRDNIWQWIEQVIYTRIEEDVRTGHKTRIVAIGTPWHEDDWIGRAIASGEWKWINLPALAEENDLLGREVGEPLNPERYSQQYFEQIRERRPLVFAAMYQGHPSPEDGDVFQKKNIQFYKELPAQEQWGARFATVDLAHSTRKRADWSVVSWWMITKPPRPRLYWLGMVRERVPSGDHLDWIEGVIKSIEPPLRPRWIVVGDKTFGSSLMDEARKHPRRGVPLFKPVEENEDKWTKAQPAAALSKNGALWLPEEMPWIGDAVPEMLIFPNGTHDDIVDTLSYAGSEFNSQPWVQREKEKSLPNTPEGRAQAKIREMRKRRKPRRSRNRLMR